MVHTTSTYREYATDQENVMSLLSPPTRSLPPHLGPPEPTLADVARRLSGARPLPLGAWREVQRTGTLSTPDDDPDATAAGLVRRWHQHWAVAIDLPVEQLAPGGRRLEALVHAWLDLARRTAPVRAFVAATGEQRTTAEAARQRVLLQRLLCEDLAALGAPRPAHAASALVEQLAAVAAREDAAGRVLRAERTELLARHGVVAPVERSLLARALDRACCRATAARPA
jgi:hypothetical protein